MSCLRLALSEGAARLNEVRSTGHSGKFDRETSTANTPPFVRSSRYECPHWDNPPHRRDRSIKTPVTKWSFCPGPAPRRTVSARDGWRLSRDARPQGVRPTGRAGGRRERGLGGAHTRKRIDDLERRTNEVVVGARCGSERRTRRSNSWIGNPQRRGEVLADAGPGAGFAIAGDA
jgi:hypothetical protein